jgi:hypothetical protein
VRRPFFAAISRFAPQQFSLLNTVPTVARGVFRSLSPPASASIPSAASTPTPATSAPAAAAVISALIMLALRRPTFPVLPFLIHIFRGKAPRTSTRVRLLVTRSVRLRICLAVRMRLFVARLIRLCIRLAIWVRLLVVRFILLARVYVRPPAASVRLLPARSGVLINVPVVPRVHIAAGIFPRIGTAVRARCPVCLSALRSLRRRHCPVRRRIVLRRRGFISLRHVRLAPLRRRARSLVRRSIRSRVRVIRLPDTLFPISCLC